jgi:hypothetical protein
MAEITNTFDFERETKGTVRYQRVNEQGRTETEYVPKSAFGLPNALGNGDRAPRKVTKTVHWDDSSSQ